MNALQAEFIQRDNPADQGVSRGILSPVKTTEWPDEDFNAFSDAPYEFENSTQMLWNDTGRVYYHACTANRFSENYLQYCEQLEKNIKELGSCCLTKAVLEQHGQKFEKLSELNINALVRMVSFHLRKAHAALDGIYQGNNLLGMTYLNWEFRWVGLGNRLKATEVKINKIKEGKINTEKWLEQAEVFKGEERSNDKAEIVQCSAMRINPSALPIKGSLARQMLGLKKEAERKADQERKEEERRQKAAEKHQREIDRLVESSLPKALDLDHDFLQWAFQAHPELFPKYAGTADEFVDDYCENDGRYFLTDFEQDWDGQDLFTPESGEDPPD